MTYISIYRMCITQTHTLCRIHAYTNTHSRTEIRWILLFTEIECQFCFWCSQYYCGHYFSGCVLYMWSYSQYFANLNDALSLSLTHSRTVRMCIWASDGNSKNLPVCRCESDCMQMEIEKSNVHCIVHYKRCVLNGIESHIHSFWRNSVQRKLHWFARRIITIIRVSVCCIAQCTWKTLCAVHLPIALYFSGLFNRLWSPHISKLLFYHYYFSHTKHPLHSICPSLLALALSLFYPISQSSSFAYPLGLRYFLCDMRFIQIECIELLCIRWWYDVCTTCNAHLSTH